MSIPAAWRQMATENFEAASELVAKNRWRSAVSRFYYAAYARMAGELLRRGVNFGKRPNPTHRAIPNLVLNNMSSPPAGTRARLANFLDILFKMRVAEDYRADVLVDHSTARDSAAYTLRVFQDLGSEGKR